VLPAGSILATRVSGGCCHDGKKWVILTTYVITVRTLRLLVGNGSRPAPTLLHEALLDLMLGRTAAQRTKMKRPGLPRSSDLDTSRKQKFKRGFLHLFSPFLIFGNPETTLLLIVNAVPYTSYYCVSATLSNLFQQKYGLSTLQVGLVFISPGLGTSLGSYLCGYFIDRDYKKFHTQRGMPLERVRLVRYPFLIFATVAPLIAYGWCVQYNVYIAVPIILLCESSYFSE
jgi:hypothetical protein